LPVEKKDCENVFHLYVVYHPKRNFIIKKLKKYNIQLNINYPIPIHKMKAYKNMFSKKRDSLPITEKMSKGIFSLPLYPKLKISEITRISKVLCKILKQI
jgi:aminotransferase EvaB